MKHEKSFRLTPAALVAIDSGILENIEAALTPGGIEAQEARGQQAFAASDNLPRDCASLGSEDVRKVLEQWGIKFGAVVDDLFVEAKLPAGWRKQPTSHPMWTDLLDERGHRRAYIFYKAAFYDRSANIGIHTAVDLLRDWFDANGENGTTGNFTHARWCASVLGKRVFTGEIFPLADAILEVERYEIAVAWLDGNYPEWRSPLAYWE